MPAESRIFIVDDGADYRFLTEQIFTRFLPQYSTRFFASGDALYQHILTSPTGKPELIILDLHMPGLSGEQVLSYLKKHPQWHYIPVIMMSSTVDEVEIAACYKAGANSFLAKPDGMTQFKEIFESVCTYWLKFNRPSQ
ncbi:response regulator [Spirosoma endbachense]|uniref:Response regulator n=1 Tax=Spirosoma endbachense TaxID=2666025 RepID=A0A6P1W592_9BACT|nr:response regulator [Spirosoma endbachense]QHW00196.1 response regulator [Spirosoma endbachense]